jgi:selenocysteine lyase/cysteine desulfurase
MRNDDQPMSTWRAEFPITERLLHLNHAGVSPISRRVAAAVRTFADEALLVDAATQVRWTARAEETRGAFATLVGARRDEIAFVKNTSEGLSLVAAGLDWHAGDNVIAVDSEYPANVYPWWGLRRSGVQTRMVQPRQGLVHVDDIAALADKRTRLVSVSFVDWSSGARNDLGAIGAWCRSRDILFCVDGIQGIGAVRLDVDGCGIDFLAVGGHKWLLAPEGCGCLFVSRRVVERVQSVLLGWKSVTDADTYLPYHFDPRRDAAKFEPGTPSTLGIVALGAALDLILEVGPDVIERRCLELTEDIAAGLRRRGAEIVSPWAAMQRSAIVVFRLPGSDPSAMCAALNADGIVVRMRNRGVRIAPHFYNNADDVERLLKAIDRHTG